MREEIPGILTAAELTGLKGLEAELRGFRLRMRRLMAQLDPARTSSSRALVRDRLLCVLLDCVEPALRDLASIEAEARERA